MKRKLMRSLVPAAVALFASGLILTSVASAQSLGGFPIREPGAGATPGGPQSPGSSKKGPLQIIVDVNGRGPYKTISAAIKDVAPGGEVFVMHGEYNEAITLDKSVYIRGDRGPGPGVRIKAPANSHCLTFKPKDHTSHAVVANVRFESKFDSNADACVDVHQGVFTLKESDVLGSGIRPAVKISGGMVFLDKNRISAGSQGILVNQTHSMMQAVITDNKILQNRVGIDIAPGSSSDVLISGNEIFDNLDSGVKSSGYGSTKLIGNKIRNNHGSGIILDKYAKLSLVRYNEIVQNSGDGIAVPFGMNGVIEDNDIVGNDGVAIFVREGMEPKITNNFIENNGGDKKKKKRRNRRRQ